MKLYHIVAMANKRVIGKDNKLPWHYPADLRFFKETTSGSTVIMGRKTFESIGRPLPNRTNIVLTRTLSLPETKNLLFCDSINEALERVKTSKAFIIGGSTLYEQTLEIVDGLYITRIYKDYEGDAHYPEIPGIYKIKESQELQSEPRIEVTYFERERSLDE